MEDFLLRLREAVSQELHLPAETPLPVSHTPFDQKGDITITLFGLAKRLGKNPAELAQHLQVILPRRLPEIADTELVKGFLNIRLSDAYRLAFLQRPPRPVIDPQPETIILEYPSPNTNKPLHLGHLRNIFLGQSIGRILEARGHTVIPVCLFNDRGTNICKSMWAWKELAHGATPETTGVKGDHFVGDYYVAYAKAQKEAVEALVRSGMTPEQAEKEARPAREVLKMLELWEAGDPETLALWKKMNQWVYEGFETTFRRLDVHFKKYYYESEVFHQARHIVEQGLAMGVFVRHPDGSVHAHLEEAGLGDKVILRANGTALYITQDLAVAEQKSRDFQFDRSVYVVGNEQDYHFKVLFEILRRLGAPGSDKLYHLSYGMVELPSGRMKSREGTVVDADPLLDEMREAARKAAQDAVKSLTLPPEEAENLYEAVGQGALRYHILRVDPRKKIVFNPEESVALQGDTGPFIQYTHARLRKLLRDAELAGFSLEEKTSDLKEGLIEPERAMVKQLWRFNTALEEAARNYNPAEVAHYAFQTAQRFSAYYQQVPILKETRPDVRNARLLLTRRVGEYLALSLHLLGIQAPEKM
ncbi:MAG: arginine--tRNA ligase [Flavobacteriales bacterium]|nr:arginine--tRNA ligase [Flavobacteriales bacterium]MCX7649064.1 arginine--tRNA ligase [Flavobacteriales bacterium]MDW8432237.1 arginine--tRNA ligase [Flavobacteriales bacterium]